MSWTRISRGLALLVGILMLSAGMVGHAQEPQYGGTLHAIINPEPPMLVMGLNLQGPTQVVAGKMYESLLTYSLELEPRPSLAKSWEVSPDGMTYTFHLQENVVWHDGTPFSADDVVFSYDVMLPEVHPRWRNVHQHIESITAPDPNTVVIRMKRPFPALMMSFSVDSAPVLPKHIYEGTDYYNNPANQTPIGTGPFKFKEWVRGSYIHLVRHDQYWQEGKPYLDGIYFHIIPDAASRAAALESGQVHMTRGEDVEFFDVARVSALPHVEATVQGWEMYAPLSWIEINHRVEPLGDKRFRQAIAHALDREFIRDFIFFGLGEIATSPINSALPSHAKRLKFYDYNVAKAVQLLDEMGLQPGPDGVRARVKLLTFPYGHVWDRLAEYIRQALGEIGIEVTIEPADAGTWAQRTANWEYEMTLNYVYQYGDPAVGVSRTYISSNIRKVLFANTMGYSNPRVDELFALAAVEQDPEQRQAYYTELQHILVEDIPNVWLLELQFPTIYDKRVHNLVTTAIGNNETYADVWIEQ